MKLYTLCLILTGIWGTTMGQPHSPGKTLNDSLQAAIADTYGASILVEVNEKPILARNYGFTSSSQAIPVSEHTLFHIGSISKSITAVAIMMLVDEKKISLDNRITRFFKGVPKNKRAITIQHLLQHTSGLRQTYVTDDISDFAEAVEAIFQDSLYYEPGTSWSYTNSNYSLLGMIIEKVTGNSYEYFIRNRILIPLDMHQTYFWGELDDTHENIFAQKVYEPSDVTKARNWGYTACGGISSTRADLKKFTDAVLYENRLLSSERYNQMLNTRYELREDLSMALGWFIGTRPDGSTEIWSRGNNDFGHNAAIQFFPSRRALIMVLTNSGEANGNPRATGNRILGAKIVRMLDY